MKRTLRLTVASLLVLACAAMLGGCVISEEDDYTMTLNDDGKSGTMTVVRVNLQSDEKEPAKQKEDFGKLMKDWKSDEYLLEKMKEGTYIKSRDLAVKGGRLVWTETSIFADFAPLVGNDVVDDTIRTSLGKDESLVSTNGLVVRMADSTVVKWPVNAKRFQLRVRHTDFHPTSDFVAEFRKHPGK